LASDRGTNKRRGRTKGLSKPKGRRARGKTKSRGETKGGIEKEAGSSSDQTQRETYMIKRGTRQPTQFYGQEKAGHGGKTKGGNGLGKGKNKELEKVGGGNKKGNKVLHTTTD